MPKATKPQQPKQGTSEKGKQPVKTSKKTKHSTAGSPKLYSNFLPIALEIPSPTPISSASSSSKPAKYTPHHVYIRAHHDKAHKEGEGRTLFVVNLPVDITERDLRVIFGRWGVVESIEFTGGTGGDALEQAVIESLNESVSDDDEEEEEDEQDEQDGDVEGQGGSRAEPTFQGSQKPNLPRKMRQRRKPTLPASVPEVTPLPALLPRDLPYGLSGLRGAHITYLDALPVKHALAHTGSIRLEKYNEKTPSGLDYYVSLHSTLRPALAAVKEFSDTSMARFDHLQSMLLSSRAKKQGAGALVDEDGFTVVVRGGRYGRTGGRGKGVAAVGVASRGFKGDGVKGKGAGELPDFYRFQQVDRKRKGESGAMALQ